MSFYFKAITLENAGPIRDLRLNAGFDSDGNPKPVVLVGGNGSGKSIVLSFIVNGLIAAQQVVFENPEIDAGRVFKLRSSDYICWGQEYSFGKVEYSEGLGFFEWHLKGPRREFEEVLAFTPIHREWLQIPENEAGVFKDTFQTAEEHTRKLIATNVVLYFPPNRFEEPAWFNLLNLSARAEFPEQSHIKGITTRRIISTSPLKANQNWLLDVLFDRQAFEIKTGHYSLSNANQEVDVPIFLGFEGNADRLYNAVSQILKVVVRSKGVVRFGVAARHSRKVSLVWEDTGAVVPNIFQMSSGETALLNLFLSILRDFDATRQEFKGLEDVCGLVVIDEVDLHLHSTHQRTVLPELMKLFPKVQFVLTTHSPLFIQGLQETVGEEGFSLFELPAGRPIGPEQFSEFEAAYSAYRASQTHRNEIKAAVEQSRMPILFVEGDYDMRYLTAAAEKLGRYSVLEAIDLQNSEGIGGLDKIRNSYDSKWAEITPQRLLLLYDCDVKKCFRERVGNVFSKVIPSVPGNPISSGIENLFSKQTLEKVMSQKPEVIDIIAAHTRTIRGQLSEVPETWAVNRGEKRNLCDWICENGEAGDFANFEDVINIIESTLLSKDR